MLIIMYISLSQILSNSFIAKDPDLKNTEIFHRKMLTIRVIRVMLYSGGEEVQRTELVRKLKKDGWNIAPGGKHGMATHPTKPGKIPIPNGSAIKDTTARGILKAAGLI